MLTPELFSRISGPTFEPTPIGKAILTNLLSGDMQEPEYAPTEENIFQAMTEASQEPESSPMPSSPRPLLTLPAEQPKPIMDGIIRRNDIEAMLASSRDDMPPEMPAPIPGEEIESDYGVEVPGKVETDLVGAEAPQMTGPDFISPKKVSQPVIMQGIMGPEEVKDIEQIGEEQDIQSQQDKRYKELIGKLSPEERAKLQQEQGAEQWKEAIEGDKGITTKSIEEVLGKEGLPEKWRKDQLMGYLKGKISKEEYDRLPEMGDVVNKSDILSKLPKTDFAPELKQVEEVVKGEPVQKAKYPGALPPKLDFRKVGERRWDEPGGWKVRQREDGNYIVINPDNVQILQGDYFDTLESAQSRAGLESVRFGRNKTKFSQYQLPGGENYRESVFNLTPELVKEMELATGEKEKISSHAFGENNFAWNRYNDRTAPDGKRVLFVEEEQIVNTSRDKISQKQYEWLKKKGLLDPSLRIKAALKKAIDGGYDYISWTTGDQQAERYDLSKHIDKVAYVHRGGDNYGVSIFKGKVMVDGKADIKANELANFIGKDIAQKIIDGEGRMEHGTKTLSKLDLKIGGEWAREYYDKMKPNILKDLTKGSVENINIQEPITVQDRRNAYSAMKEIPEDYKRLTQPALKITPEVKNKVLGIKPTAKGGEIGDALIQEAKKYNTAEEFIHAHRQSHLMDLSNPEKHWAGRAIPMYEDELFTDILQIIKDKDRAGSYLSTMKYSNPAEYKAITSSGDMITIYRAVPSDKSDDIRVGDYVALDKKYAQMHLDSVLEGQQGVKGKIISKTVPKKDIVWGEADFTEWAYSPKELRDKYKSLKSIWEQSKLSPREGK